MESDAGPSGSLAPPPPTATPWDELAKMEVEGCEDKDDPSGTLVGGVKDDDDELGRGGGYEGGWCCWCGGGGARDA